MPHPITSKHFAADLKKEFGKVIFPASDEEIPNVKRFEERIQNAQKISARSFMVEVTNLTSLPFKRGAISLKHGIWTLKPQETIPPQSVAIFGTQSFGLAKTLGQFSFFSDDPHSLLFVKWNLPLIKKPLVTYDASTLLRVGTEMDLGHRSVVRISLKFTHLPGVPRQIEGESKNLLEHLSRETHFDVIEVHELLETYKSFLSPSSTGLSKEDFRRVSLNFLMTN